MEDSGPGLPPEQREEVFGPGVGAWQHGLGLGLAFCQNVVDSHGGAITIGDSPALGGASIRVRYPL